MTDQPCARTAKYSAGAFFFRLFLIARKKGNCLLKPQKKRAILAKDNFPSRSNEAFRYIQDFENGGRALSKSQ